MKRLALRTLVASVALSALMGSWAMLPGEFGETRSRVLFTMLALSGAGVLAIECSRAWDRRWLPPVPQAGVGLAVAAATLVIAGIWADIRWNALRETTLTLTILAVSAAHASLVSLTRLSPGRRWVSKTTLCINVALGAGLIACVWIEPDSPGVARILGVVSILLCAGTILIPVLHRMDRGAATAARAALRPSGPRFCVSCGSPEVLPEVADVHACSACGARFRADVVTDLS